MRTLSVIVLFVLLFPPAPALADYGGPPPPAPSTGPPADAPRGDAPRADAPTGRVERAQQLYASGYDEVVKADMDLKRGKAKEAEKRWARARERLREAVVLDTTHVEAWNLIGFTSRRLREYDESFAAYRTALRQKPLFALAREYYGQGLLETGDLEGAKQQLMWLKKIGDAPLTAQLEQSIAAYEAEHGGAAADSTGAETR
jgi:tetratricopeptide (TPR) repeat protein